jgi:hypothetical protein
VSFPYRARVLADLGCCRGAGSLTRFTQAFLTVTPQSKVLWPQGLDISEVRALSSSKRLLQRFNERNRA